MNPPDDASAPAADRLRITEIFCPLQGEARAAEAPGRGYHWGMEAVHSELPRGERHWTGTVGSLEQIMHGPSCVPDGTMNLVGALRRAMATSGYSELKEFQRVDVTVSPCR